MLHVCNISKQCRLCYCHQSNEVKFPHLDLPNTSRTDQRRSRYQGSDTLKLNQSSYFKTDIEIGELTNLFMEVLTIWPTTTNQIRSYSEAPRILAIEADHLNSLHTNTQQNQNG